MPLCAPSQKVSPIYDSLEKEIVSSDFLNPPSLRVHIRVSEDRALLRTHLERRRSLANGGCGRFRATRPAQGRSLGRSLPEQAQGQKSQGGSGDGVPIPLCASPRAVTGELKGNIDLTVPL